MASLPLLELSAEMSHPPVGAEAAVAATAAAPVAAADEVVANLPPLWQSVDADRPPAGAAAAAAAPVVAVDEVGESRPRGRTAREVLDPDLLVGRGQDLGVRRSPLLPYPGKGRQAGATVGVMADGTRSDEDQVVEVAAVLRAVPEAGTRGMIELADGTK